MSSPTQRSLKFLRDNGYLAEVVERWIPGANIRKDLWGWCDILALSPDRNILAVQTTTKKNMSARIQKISDSETVSAVREAGIAINVHGWEKRAGRWQLSVKDCS